MLGHEGVQAAVVDYLTVAIPAFLTRIRTDLAVDSPAAPAIVMQADVLPDDPGLYPAVVVQSTSMNTWQALTSRVAGEPCGYVFEYDLAVVVACRTDDGGGPVKAASDRSRLLLAVREALMLTDTLTGEVSIVRGSLRERTGAASQDLRGRPLSAGQVDFQVRAEETLIPLTDVEIAAAIDLVVTGNDATKQAL